MSFDRESVIDVLNGLRGVGELSSLKYFTEQLTESVEACLGSIREMKKTPPPSKEVVLLRPIDLGIAKDFTIEDVMPEAEKHGLTHCSMEAALFYFAQHRDYPRRERFIVAQNEDEHRVLPSFEPETYWSPAERQRLVNELPVGEIDAIFQDMMRLETHVIGRLKEFGRIPPTVLLMFEKKQA